MADLGCDRGRGNQSENAERTELHRLRQRAAALHATGGIDLPAMLWRDTRRSSTRPAPAGRVSRRGSLTIASALMTSCVLTPEKRSRRHTTRPITTWLPRRRSRYSPGASGSSQAIIMPRDEILWMHASPQPRTDLMRRGSEPVGALRGFVARPRPPHGSSLLLSCWNDQPIKRRDKERMNRLSWVLESDPLPGKRLRTDRRSG